MNALTINFAPAINLEAEIIVFPKTLLGETVLPGFVFNLEQVG